MARVSTYLNFPAKIKEAFSFYKTVPGVNVIAWINMKCHGELIVIKNNNK